MIKLTDKMRESLVKTGMYVSARLIYTYCPEWKQVFKKKRDGTIIEAAAIDLNRWALLKSYDERNGHEKT